MIQKKHVAKVSTLSRLKDTLNALGIEGDYLNIMKATCEKPTGNIVLNGER